MCISVCAPQCSVPRGQKGALDPLTLELQEVTSCPSGYGELNLSATRAKKMLFRAERSLHIPFSILIQDYKAPGLP